jgi:hypothetical protein
LSDVLEAIAGWPGAGWLQQSSTAYLFVNAAHILGVAVLLGAILPLDLRLLGFFRGFPVEVLGPFLVRCAAAGLTLALLAGAWLFSVKPDEYLANAAFRWKLAFLALALVNVGLQHHGSGYLHGSPAVRARAGLSFCLWLSALVAGRWIGFV